MFDRGPVHLVYRKLVVLKPYSVMVRFRKEAQGIKSGLNKFEVSISTFI
jgi:hypothetical protein